jgi:hypothetical protein
VEVPRVGEARYRGAALGLAIGGAAAAGAGLFFHLRSIDEYDTFNAMPASTPTGHCSRGYADRGGTECAGVLDRADRARYFAIAGYVVGGAALAVAAGLVFLPGPAPGGSAAAVAWSCTPDLLQNGIRCALRF